MEDIWERPTANERREPAVEHKEKLRDRLDKLEEQVSLGDMKKDTELKQKDWKFPFKWRRQMNASAGKAAEDKVLVLYYNIKGIIEPPKLVPLYSGNIIIYKNKAYEFDPRATWIIQLGKKMIKCVSIKEIDRRPISNLDWDEIKKRGDATDSDEILVKMVTKAVIEKQKTKVNTGMIVIIVIIILAAIGFFMFMK